MKGINTEMAEKSLLCTGEKLIGIDIKDGKRPRRSILSLGPKVGAVIESHWLLGKNKSHPSFGSFPGQQKPRVFWLFP